ncbi:MAG: efflux RND transporter periplasmic adaptor subunit [Blastocatellia bacterium]
MPRSGNKVDRKRAGQLGVTVEQIGRSLVAATSSSRFTQPVYWRDPASGTAYQVQVEIPQSRIASIEDVPVALWITGTTLNVQSFMGAIMAIGVSVANAILLVTFAEQRRREGQEANAAAMGAAIAGMIPMALGLGEGSEQIAPLGRAVIGGLAASTIAVLTVAPLVFALAQRKANRASASLHPEDMKPNLFFIVFGAVALASPLAACSGKKAIESQSQITSQSPQTPTVNVTTVQSLELNRQIRLPGELHAWQDTAIYAKVQGFVEEVNVDRGSAVKKGQLLARLRAPELDTQRSEAEAKVRAAESQRVEALARVSGIRAQRIEAEAKLAAEEATYQRLKSASATPGAVAGNDVEIAQRTVEAGKARIQLWQENEKVARAQVEALEESEQALREAARSMQNIESYLRITAPFDGVIVERNAHQGSLASPTGAPMLRLQQVSRLRLVISVPEAEVASVKPGARINFTLPAFPGETFSGGAQRSSRSLDSKTRTMPVELDVANASGRLAPGMFPEVTWPTRRLRPSLFAPPPAIATTTERTFVIRIRDGMVEWVDVKRGASMNYQGVDLVEIFGDLEPGDQIALRGADELRAGAKVNVRQTSLSK